MKIVIAQFFLLLTLGLLVPQSIASVTYEAKVSDTSINSYKYSQTTPKGKTFITLNKDLSSLYLYFKLNSSEESRINTEQIINNFYSLINYYDLGNKVAHLDQVSINYIIETNTGVTIGHWPILLKINDDISWPNNFINFYQLNNDNSSQFSLYSENLRKIILSNNAYGPFRTFLLPLGGCNLELAEYYADPIPRGGYSANRLVKGGVFKQPNIKKDYYPFFKGGITFACKN